MFIHPPRCCVGVAVAAKAGAGLWLLSLCLAALAAQRGPVHPTQASTPALCRHPAWGLPLGGMASPPVLLKISLCHPQTPQGSYTGFKPWDFLAVSVLQDGLLKPADCW